MRIQERFIQSSGGEKGRIRCVKHLENFSITKAYSPREGLGLSLGTGRLYILSPPPFHSQDGKAHCQQGTWLQGNRLEKLQPGKRDKGQNQLYHWRSERNSKGYDQVDFNIPFSLIKLYTDFSLTLGL